MLNILNPLLEAFAGESIARNKYSYYASKAKKEGYVQVAKLFEKIVHNEQEHAKIWFKLLHGGTVASALELCSVCKYPKAYFMLQLKIFKGRQL